MHKRSIRTFDDKSRRQLYRIYYSIKWYLLTSNKWISELIILIVQAAANCSTFTNTNFDWFIDDIFFFVFVRKRKYRASLPQFATSEQVVLKGAALLFCVCVSTNGIQQMHWQICIAQYTHVHYGWPLLVSIWL